MKGTNNSVVSVMNKSLILKLISENKQLTRSQLSKMTKLSEAAISKIIRNLISDNLIREIRYIKGEYGRRAIGLELNTDEYKILGIHFSRREFSIGIFNLYSELEISTVHYYTSLNLEVMLHDVLEQIKKIVDSYNNIIACGIAVPGPYNNQTGEISLITEIEGAKKINLKKFFEDNLNIPVKIIHDAKSGAKAHYEKLKLKDETLVYYHVGQGVGSGVIQNNNLIFGRNGMAGEIGHVSLNFNGERCHCGNYGCLEQYCSSLSLLKRYRLINNQNVTVKSLIDLADKGDEECQKLLTEEAEYISFGLVTIFNTYNPDVVVIGDELALAKDYIEPVLEKVLKERNLLDIYKEVDIKYIDNYELNYILVGAGVSAVEYCLENYESIS